MYLTRLFVFQLHFACLHAFFSGLLDRLDAGVVCQTAERNFFEQGMLAQRVHEPLVKVLHVSHCGQRGKSKSPRTESTKTLCEERPSRAEKREFPPPKSIGLACVNEASRSEHKAVQRQRRAAENRERNTTPRLRGTPVSSSARFAARGNQRTSKCAAANCFA